MGTVTNGTADRKPRASRPAHGTVKWVLPLTNDFGILEIAGAASGSARYTIVRIAGGFRLLKSDGTVYDLNTEGEHWTCDCPDYLHARANNDPRGCKHCCGVRAALAHLSKPIALKDAPAPAHGSLGDQLKNDPPATPPVEDWGEASANTGEHFGPPAGRKRKRFEADCA